MDFPLNVDVHCIDRRCGISTHIIFNPANDKLTHLVVEEHPSGIERLVPTKLVVCTTAEVIVLNCSKQEFSQLERFNLTDFVFTNIPFHATDPKLTLLWPYAVPSKRVIDERIRRIPPGELAVNRGAQVRATDGRIGKVDEFLVDPDTCYITHLILREGHIFGKRVIAIPVSQIDHIEEKLVYLKLDKKGVESLPDIAIKRPWQSN